MKRSDSLDLMYRAIREGPMEDLSAFSARPRLAALLDHFAEIADARQGCKVLYPLREVLFWWCAAPSRAATTMMTSSIGQGAPRVTAPICRISFRHSLRRLAALYH